MFESLILVFVGVALLSVLALFSRQPLILVYVLVGAILGPYALGWIGDAEVISEIGEIGVIFLLFIVGLDLPPSKLLTTLGSVSLVAILSSATFLLLGFGIAYLFGFTLTECVITGITCMFSSTVLGVKLLPTSVLHHRHIGELVIGILLIQDLIAIIALIYLHIFTPETASQISAAEGAQTFDWITSLALIPVVFVFAYLGSQYIVWPLLSKFDVYTDFVLLFVLGWCLFLAGSTYLLGIGFELGAFIAGVALANAPAAQSIAQSMSVLRDFFLVLFFFSVGAGVDWAVTWEVLWQIIVLGGILILVKPALFRFLLHLRGEDRGTGWEVGVRLGQCSEFSLLILYLVANQISPQATHVILGAVILTFVISTYGVVFRYKSPMAVFDWLRAD